MHPSLHFTAVKKCEIFDPSRLTFLFKTQQHIGSLKDYNIPHLIFTKG